jgi:hypothetical protein
MNIEERGEPDGVENFLNVIAEGTQSNLAIYLLDPLGERHQNGKTRAGHEIDTVEIHDHRRSPRVDQAVKLFLQ